LGAAHPDIFGTMLVPKGGDLTRDLGRKEVPKQTASRHFLEALQEAFKSIYAVASDRVPVTVYYAFKQAEVDASDDEDGSIVASTGWETLLEGLFRAGLQVTGTWPLRTESVGRLRAIGSNALAASIILVCRKRRADAGNATKGEFLAALKRELPLALKDLQRSNIAPVDLAQASIGPGMSIYTRYANVIDAAGNAVPIRDALAIINQSLDEVLAEQEGEFDADSRWAVAWFDQFGFSDGEYGIAEVLSKAKNTAVAGLVQAGIVNSKRGKVRLLKPAELAEDWDPTNDVRFTAWEAVHQSVRLLESGGEDAAATLVAKLGARAELVRDLAYRLYSVCERKKRATEALSYNGLVQSWPEITRLSREARPASPLQSEMFR
jgi:putative DNA methylase